MGENRQLRGKGGLDDFELLGFGEVGHGEMGDDLLETALVGRVVGERSNDGLSELCESLLG